MIFRCSWIQRAYRRLEFEYKVLGLRCGKNIAVLSQLSLILLATAKGWLAGLLGLVFAMED